MIESKEFSTGVMHYAKAAGITGHIGEQITGIPMSETIINQWAVLYTAVSIVDDRLDDLKQPEQRQAFTADLNRFMHGSAVDFSQDPLLLEAMERVKELSLSLAEDKRPVFITALRGILKVTEQIRLEKDPKRFSTLRRLEGQLSARALTVFLNDEQLMDGSYPRLLKVFKRLGRAANCVDSILDLKDDHDNGEILIKPSIRNKAILFINAVPDGAFVLLNTRPSRKLYRHLVGAVDDSTAGNFKL